MTVGWLFIYLTLAAIPLLVLALVARLLRHDDRDRATPEQRNIDDLRGRGA